MWTSPNYLSLLGIVTHFTDERGQLTTITLGLPEIHGTHSGYNQARAVIDTLEQYQIRNKLGYFVMDNDGRNDTLIKHVAADLAKEGVT